MMSELHDELIADTPFDGIVCGFVRNPSLDRSSNQCLEITKVKRDPQDNTIGLSVMILKGYNASDEALPSERKSLNSVNC